MKVSVLTAIGERGEYLGEAIFVFDSAVWSNVPHDRRGVLVETHGDFP